MSGFAPPESPTGWLLQFQKTNEPVSGYAGRWYAEQLAFLLAHNLELVTQIYPNPVADDTNNTLVRFPYWPSPGAKALLVGVDHFGPGQANIAVVSSGVSLIDAGVPPLDGSTPIRGNNPSSRQMPHFAVMKVTDFSGLSTITVLRDPVPSVFGAQDSGIQRIFAFEVPRAGINPASNPTTDVSFNYTWGIPPGRLEDGSATTMRGFKRLVSQQIKATKEVRNHRTLATLEDTSNSWHVTSTSFVPLIVNAPFYWRAVKHFDTSTANPTKLYVRYKSDQSWTLRIFLATTGGSANHDFTFSSSGSFTADSSNTLNLPTDNTDPGNEQFVFVQIEAKLLSAGDLYVSCVSAIDNFT